MFDNGFYKKKNLLSLVVISWRETMLTTLRLHTLELEQVMKLKLRYTGTRVIQ